MEIGQVITIVLVGAIAVYFLLCLLGALPVISSEEYQSQTLECLESKYEELLAAKEVEISEKDKLIDAQMEYIKEYIKELESEMNLK